MVNLYDLLRHQRVHVTTLDELHMVQELLRKHHPEATQDYIDDDILDAYPYIGCEEDAEEGDIFVGFLSPRAGTLYPMTFNDFLYAVMGEEEPDDEIDLSSLL